MAECSPRRRLGITGGGGFIGAHLAGLARTAPDFEPVLISREAWEDPTYLSALTGSCDVVIHLAGLSRHPDGDHLYRVNLELAGKLASAWAAAASGGKVPHIYLAGTTHNRDLPYHRSKRAAAALLARTAAQCGGRFTELKLPNVFGPYGRPFYNSVVATFCALAARGETPERIDPVMLELIDVVELSRRLLDLFRRGGAASETVPAQYQVALPELWRRLTEFAAAPEPLSFPDRFSRDLFNAFSACRTGSAG